MKVTVLWQATRYSIYKSTYASSLVEERMVSSGTLRRLVLVRKDISEELSASFIRVKRIDELRTTLAVTSCASVASYS
jgi:hypothetical protein